MSHRIFIIGAGPAGCATALKLSKHGISSTIVDKAVFPRDKICGDALSGKVVDCIRKIDERWVNEFRTFDKAIGSYGILFSSPKGATLKLPFTPDYKTTKVAPGFVAKRLDFDNWLVEKVKKEKLITLIENTTISSFVYRGSSWMLEDKTGNKYEANIVVAADGAYSQFAKDIGKLETEEEHNCFGLRAYYKGVSNLDEHNFIELHFIDEFLPGYFWIFPLPNGEANVGAGIRADYLKNKKVNLKKAVEQIIKHHPVFSKRFEHAELIEPIKLFGLPLGSKKRQLYGNHFLLTGDAAMLIDPFTGEGIGNAMISGLVAADTLEEIIKKGQSFDSISLSKYQQVLERKLRAELQLSRRLQQLANYPKLFNFVLNRAANNEAIRDTFSAMFYDVNIRSKLKNPLFYLELLFSGFKSKNNNMKNIILIVALSFTTSIFAQRKALVCDPSKEANYKSLTKQNEAGGYGKVISKDGAITLAMAEKKMKEQGAAELDNIVVKGKVVEVCQKKGCWMTVDNGKGEQVRIRFEDYSFFAPMNTSGWTVYAQGVAFYDTTSVAMLKHYAEDAKKPQAEIDKITEPLVSLNFTAVGILFEKKKK